MSEMSTMMINGDVQDKDEYNIACMILRSKESFTS